MVVCTAQPWLCPVRCICRILFRILFRFYITFPQSPFIPLAFIILIRDYPAGSPPQKSNRPCSPSPSQSTTYIPGGLQQLHLWSAHSLRVGACVILHAAGFTEPQIQFLLRWCSTSFLELLAQHGHPLREATCGSNGPPAFLEPPPLISPITSPGSPHSFALRPLFTRLVLIQILWCITLARDPMHTFLLAQMIPPTLFFDFFLFFRPTRDSLSWLFTCLPPSFLRLHSPRGRSSFGAFVLGAFPCLDCIDRVKSLLQNSRLPLFCHLPSCTSYDCR